MADFFGTDQDLVRRALKLQGSDYELPPLDPSLRQLPDIGPTSQVIPNTPPAEDPYAGVLAASAQYAQPTIPAPPETTAPAPTETTTPAPVETTAPAPVETTTPAPTEVEPNAGSLSSANLALRDMQQAADAHSQSIAQVADAQAEGYAREAEARKQAQQEIERIRAQAEWHQEDYRRQFNEGMAQLKQIHEQAAQLPSPKDRRANVKKLMGGIAVALGGLSDHFAMVGGAHTDNADQIQRQINTVIERDIQAQREAIANKRADAQAKQTEMGLAQQHFGATMEADKLGALMVKERSANDLGIIAAETNNKQVKAQVLGAQAALRSEVAKEKLGLYKSLMAKKLSATQARILGYTPEQAAVFNASIGAEGGSADPEALPAPPENSPQPIPDRRTRTTRSADTQQAMEADIPGHYRSMPDAWYTPERTKAAHEYNRAHKAYITGTRQLENYWSIVTDPKKPMSERRAALSSYNRYRLDVIAKSSIKNDQGVVTNPEMVQRVESMPSPPLTWLQETEAQFNELARGMSYSPTMFKHMREEQEAEAAEQFDTFGLPFKAAHTGGSQKSTVPTWTPGMPIPGKTK